MGAEQVRPDAAAWALIAFWRHEEMRELLNPLGEALQKEQEQDGRVPIDPHFPLAAWPTPLALLAWLQQTDKAGIVTRSVDFLLTWHGLHWVNREPEVLGHDTSLVGWPWVTGAHSWIEPTSLALLALNAAGSGGHARCQQARQMILNRQLPKGGWNFGNTTVYGHELRPMLHSTGMALTALAKAVEPEAVDHSIRYLEAAIQPVRAPLSLGWGVIGLSAWNRRPEFADQWIAECLEKEQSTTEYDLALLGLLYCALLPNEQNPLLGARNS